MTKITIKSKMMTGTMIIIFGAGMFIFGNIIAAQTGLFYKDIGETFVICGIVTEAMTLTAMIATIIHSAMKSKQPSDQQKEIVSLNDKTPKEFRSETVYR